MRCAQQLEDDKQVRSFTFITKDDAFEEFKRIFRRTTPTLVTT